MTQLDSPLSRQRLTMSAQGAPRFSIDAAARVLGVSRPTIRRRLRDGVLKGSQVTTPHGRKWYVDLEGAAGGSGWCGGRSR